MIDEIKSIGGGKFIVIDRKEIPMDVHQLRQNKQQLEKLREQAKESLTEITVNLGKICLALGKEPPENIPKPDEKLPLQVSAPPALSPSDPSTRVPVHPADNYNPDGTLKEPIEGYVDRPPKK